MSYPEPIKGAGQYLKSFEKDIEYITTGDVKVDDDGYVRGDREKVFTLRAAVVPLEEDELKNLEYGDDIVGFNGVYIRTRCQDIIEKDFKIRTGDYFKIDGQEWKILVVDDYGTVIKCSCGLSTEDGYKISGSG